MNENRPTVVYWNNIPSPYIIDRLNALHERGTLDLEVWFSERREPDRSWQVDESTWKFRYRYLPEFRLGRFRMRLPFRLFRLRPDLILSLYGTSEYMLGWVIAKLLRIKTGIRVLKIFDSWFPRHWAKELLKHFLFRFVDVVETAGTDGKEYAVSYGIAPERVKIVPHTVNVEVLLPAVTRARANREQWKADLGLTGVVFLYVGRLWSGKGVDSLIDAFAMLTRTCEEDVSLLLVGDGQDEAELRSKVERLALSNVCFAGFREQDELAAMFAVSDVFVFPTLGDPYGLVVDEAMACGLPVISTTAAGEITDRVEEGVSGHLVPPGAPEELASRMAWLAGDATQRSKMGSEAARKVADHTPEAWASGFEELVQQTLR